MEDPVSTMAPASATLVLRLTCLFTRELEVVTSVHSSMTGLHPKPGSAGFQELWQMDRLHGHHLHGWPSSALMPEGVVHLAVGTGVDTHPPALQCAYMYQRVAGAWARLPVSLP